MEPADRPVSPAETIKPEPPVDVQEEPTVAERGFQLDRANLEQEVGQVLGTLNSWWGGVKKQSVSALTTFKADLDKTVIQAQADLEHLRTAKIEVVRKEEAESKGKERQVVEGPSLLDRLSSSTSQLQSTIQSTLAANPTLTNPAQLRAQIVENLRLTSARDNLQLSVKQAEKLAEEYMRKGDTWVKEGQKWMEDAVKVVPPEGDVVGVSWDGSDFYSFSTSTPVKEGNTPRAPVSGAALAGSRKEALLRRLREDKELLLVDPAGPAETEERRKEFREWLDNDWIKVKAEDREEGAVGGIRMELVPESLTDEQFWQRYLFHKHMIEAEEERRKRLLAATETTQEDFSWDDEPEPTRAEETTPTSKSPDRLSTAPAVAVPPLGKANQSTSTSPRDSEESYDLVSDQGQKPKPPATEDDEDSDWE